MNELFSNLMSLEGAYKLLLASQFVFAFITIILLFFVTAPYGKHSNKKFGPLVNPRLGWILMELPAFAVILFMFFYLKAYTNPVYVAFIIIWEIHYVQRTFIYPFLINKKGKPMAILIPIFGMMFNSMNGFVNGFGVFGGVKEYTNDWFLSPQFISGVIIFAIGMFINIHSDYVLRTLRKPGETGYKIPNKGAHKLVASPNYLGEFLEWTGWAVMTWSLAGLAFALFTFANLGPRAYKNKLWYREKFGDEYPENRKSIIPFLF